MQQLHFRELDGMRGVLACTVMLYHLGLNSVLSAVTGGALRDGTWELCVDFFFILSGFVLMRSFIRRPVSLRGYWEKRVLRLAPLFLLTTAVLLMIRPGAWSWSTVLANLLMIQSLLGLPSINFPGWSIPFELFFPAVLLLLHRALRGMRPTTLVLMLTGILLASAIVAYELSARAVADGTLAAMRAGLGLSAGGLLYLVLEKQTCFRGASRSLTYAAMACVFAIMAVSGVRPEAALLFPFAAVAAVWFGSHTNGLFSRGAFQELGRSSYSIYLWHIPILYAARELTSEYTVRGIAAKALLVSIILLVSFLTYRGIELPGIRLADRTT